MVAGTRTGSKSVAPWVSGPPRTVHEGAVVSDRNTLSVDNDVLVVIPRGLDKFWGFRRRITVPLSAISGVAIEHRPHDVPIGWRGPGLDGFGKLVGTFHPSGERHYWNFSGKGSVLRVDIEDGKPFDRLYLSVADVADAYRMVREAAHRV